MVRLVADERVATAIMQAWKATGGDVCGVIDLDTDYTGTIELWDEDWHEIKNLASAQVSLSEARNRRARYGDVEVAGLQT